MTILEKDHPNRMVFFFGQSACGRMVTVKIRNLIVKIKTFITKISLKSWLIGGGILAVALYGLVFFIPKDVRFSYATKTCVGQFVLMPNLERVDSSQFDIEFKDNISLGGLVLASKTTCFTPKTSPEAGNFTASVSPFGGWIARKQFHVAVPASPVAQVSDLVGKPISTVRPLKIKLTSIDIIHTYSLKIADQKAGCTEAAAELSCDIVPLNLSQGADYATTLYQVYKDSDKKVVEGTLQTLKPLTVTTASVAEGQTIYDKPTSFSFTFDQAVAGNDISLVSTTGDKTEDVPLKKDIQGQKVTVSFTELTREANYRLTIKQAIGENGSSLAVPVNISFQTSGGPKVTSVSAGSNSVSRNATIIVSLDQPIDASVDPATYAHSVGVTTTVRRQSDTQLAFTIQGGDCAAFNLIVDKGIKGGLNGEPSKEAWKFTSRTICGYSWTIGQSVQGRPIVAYSFGSGATTVLFTGGMHGSEPSGYATMLALAQYLRVYGNIVPADKRIVIVPNMNPDGIAANSRNNNQNVNIDRNFPTADWEASIVTASGTLPTGGGVTAGSEPETTALMTLTRQLQPRLEVSFHAQGALVGANKYADSTAIGDIYASTVGYATMYYDAEAVMGYPMTGEYEDWMGEAMGIPAILIELPTTSGNYLNSQLTALKKMLAI
jgi:protein MpaA